MGASKIDTVSASELITKLYDLLNIYFPSVDDDNVWDGIERVVTRLKELGGSMDYKIIEKKNIEKSVENKSDNKSDIKRYLVLLNNTDFKDRQTEYFFVYAKDFDDANYKFACSYLGRYDISIFEINNYRQFCFIENNYLFSGVKEITDIGLITNELKKVKDFKREVVE
jgi:hypothetical protein